MVAIIIIIDLGVVVAQDKEIVDEVKIGPMTEGQVEPKTIMANGRKCSNHIMLGNTKQTHMTQLKNN